MPQLDALRASLRALQRDLHLTKTKVDVVEGWVTWVLVCCAYLALVYAVLAVGKVAWLAVWRLWASPRPKDDTQSRVFRRSMSTNQDNIPSRRYPLHKSTIHSLDLPDPRSRALYVPVSCLLTLFMLHHIITNMMTCLQAGNGCAQHGNGQVFGGRGDSHRRRDKCHLPHHPQRYF
jgi:hypothetical protein